MFQGKSLASVLSLVMSVALIAGLVPATAQAASGSDVQSPKPSLATASLSGSPDESELTVAWEQETVANPIEGPSTVTVTEREFNNGFSFTSVAHFSCKTHLEYSKVSGSEDVYFSDLGMFGVTHDPIAGEVFRFTVDVKAARESVYNWEEDRSYTYEENHKLVEVVLQFVPGRPSWEGCVMDPGEMTVEWWLSDDRNDDNCDGYQIQVASRADFSDAVTAVVEGQPVHYKRFTGLTPGNSYYARVRAYVDSTEGRLYGEWATGQSGKVKKQTKRTRADVKRAQGRYRQIKKAALKNGWRIGGLGRKVRAYGGASNDQPIIDWYVTCWNDAYVLYAFIATSTYGTDDRYKYWIKDHGELASDLMGFKTVKRVDSSGRFHSYDSVAHRWSSKLSKGILKDLKTYAVGNKKPFLRMQTLALGKGESDVIKVLNTNKKVTLDFVRVDSKNRIVKLKDKRTLRKLKWEYTIKRLSKTSFKITRKRSMYTNLETIRLRCGGKSFYCTIA